MLIANLSCVIKLLASKHVEQYLKTVAWNTYLILSIGEIFYESWIHVYGLKKIKDGVRGQASNRVKPFLLYPWESELIRHTSILAAVEWLTGPL